MAGPKEGEGGFVTEDQKEYGDQMDLNVHEDKLINESELIEIDLPENPIYESTEPVFHFRSSALGLQADKMKIVLYTFLGYFLYTRFIK
jgi:hypothetical protein